ncbi:MAG: acetyl-CoA carboxylase, biotin carboxyl carrier protein, partial [Elusimicrobiota bacterium]|nr:acetyl-CoA carboxylase, biotin carboxyl carrier protein [Elusimicrobiota bacterium]
MAKNNEIKERVKALYDIMVSEGLEELDVDLKEYSVSIKRPSSANKMPKVLQQNAQNLDSGSAESSGGEGGSSIAAAQTQASAAVQAAPTASPTIKSPITGIFYRAASPTTPAFVNEGDVVEVGKTICIIEAMKVMNEVNSPFKVKILKALVENAKPVNA